MKDTMERDTRCFGHDDILVAEAVVRVCVPGVDVRDRYGRVQTQVVDRGHFGFGLEPGHEAPGDTSDDIASIFEYYEEGFVECSCAEFIPPSFPECRSDVKNGKEISRRDGRMKGSMRPAIE